MNHCCWRCSEPLLLVVQLVRSPEASPLMQLLLSLLVHRPEASPLMQLVVLLVRSPQASPLMQLVHPAYCVLVLPVLSNR